MSIVIVAEGPASRPVATVPLLSFLAGQVSPDGDWLPVYTPVLHLQKK